MCTCIMTPYDALVLFVFCLYFRSGDASGAVVQVTDPYLNLFRGLVPPLLGTIDFTPLFGFFILQFLEGTLDLGAEDEW